MCSNMVLLAYLTGKAHFSYPLTKVRKNVEGFAVERTGCKLTRVFIFMYRIMEYLIRKCSRKRMKCEERSWRDVKAYGMLRSKVESEISDI